MGSFAQFWHPAVNLRSPENLAQAIRQREGATAKARSIRELIESVVVHRTEPGEPVRLRVDGHLAALIGEPVFPDGSMSGVKVVAGDRYIASPTIGAALFTYRRRAA